MKHLQITAHWPDGRTLEVGYGENWRKIRANLRRQKRERPGCTFTVERIKPEARWVLKAYTYRMLRMFDRQEKRRENGPPFKFLY